MTIGGIYEVHMSSNSDLILKHQVSYIHQIYLNVMRTAEVAQVTLPYDRHCAFLASMYVLLSIAFLIP